MKSPLTTLCYIEKDEQYLMLHRIKKENDINQWKRIGVWGHFEYGESPEDCLLREVQEETGLTLKEFQFRGIVTFISDQDPSEYMCLYTASKFEGQIKECNEGELHRINKKEIQNLNLREGDKIFLRLLDETQNFFSLKLIYQDGKLMESYLNGEIIQKKSDF